MRPPDLIRGMVEGASLGRPLRLPRSKSEVATSPVNGGGTPLFGAIMSLFLPLFGAVASLLPAAVISPYLAKNSMYQLS